MDIDRNKHTADWMNGNKITHSIIDFILIIVALVVVITSIFGAFGSPVSDWFSRSGSVLVLIGAVLEYRYNRFSQIAIEESIRWASGVGGPTVFVFVLAWHRVVVKYIAHTFIVCGTLIWGYGNAWA